MSLLEEDPARPVHPARTKNDRVRQVSWLAGRRRSGPPSQNPKVPMAFGPMAHRSQLQGQPGYRTPFPLNPLSGNLSRGGQIPCVAAFRKPRSCRTLAQRRPLSYPRWRNGCPKGLNREVRNGHLAKAGTAPATVIGERFATCHWGLGPEKAARARGTEKSGNRPVAVDPSRGRDVPGGRGLNPLRDDIVRNVEGGSRDDASQLKNDAMARRAWCAATMPATMRFPRRPLRRHR